MRISELCEQAGIAAEYGGEDSWGYVYETDEYHFGFEFRQHVLCFRYRTCEGSNGWFVNIRSPGENPTLVFRRIHESDVEQTLICYFARDQHSPVKRDSTRSLPVQAVLKFS
jgi:hypothetical protein